MTKVYHMSKSNEWSTPESFFKVLDNEFGFTLDPCCTHGSAKCEKHFTPEEDGLIQSWQGEVVFMNPPYGREIGKWIEKAYNEWIEGNCTIICLIPSRTDTKYWQKYIWSYDQIIASEVRFVAGRIKFGDGKGSAPFPSSVVIYKKHIE